MAVTVRDSLGGQVPAGWQPQPCPDLVDEPWHGVNVPWRTPIIDWKVDTVRTQALARSDVNVPVDVAVTDTVWEGSVAGMPYQDVANLPLTPVWDLARPITWNWFSPTFPIDRLPLPALVRREGDPLAAWDRHWYGIDRAKGRLYESIQLSNDWGARFRTWGQCDWTSGYPGSGPGTSTWDMTRPWDGPGQPRGIVAGAFPHMPHFLRYDELARGEVRHALCLALANYAPGCTGYARGFDGSMASHPLWAGERLRLPATAVEWFTPGTPERTVAKAMNVYGITLGDRTDHSGSATSKHGVIPAAQDPRIKTKTGWKGMGLRLADFEVVTQA